MTNRRLNEIVEPENFWLIVFILLFPVLDSAFFVLVGAPPFLLLFASPLVAVLVWTWIAMHRSPGM